VEHSMRLFGTDPGWWYTDMRGFGPTLVPWLWFKLYWISWALLLAVVARLLWARGREQSLKNRLRAARHRFSGATTTVALGASGLIVTIGSFIFYNTNVLNEYLTGSNINERKAEYERRYGQYRNIPQPQLKATKLNIELYPDNQQVRINGTYTLTNDNDLPVDSIHMGSVSGIAFEEVKFNRPAVGVLIDNVLSHSIYVLKQPLQPGDSLQLKFVVNYKQRGFAHIGGNELVVENGTYFTNLDMLPSIGYQPTRELNDAVLRKNNRLADRPAIPI
jgi:ABC-2 type transport system permease protein